MSLGRGFLRVLLSTGSVAAIAWAVAIFVYASSTGSLVASAARLANGETYRPEVMRALARRAAEIDQDRCDDRVLIGVATIQARMAEDAVLLGELNVVDERLRAVETTSANLVRCSPRQGIGWLMLFWSRSLQQGFRPELIPLLEASYRYSPREAWVAVRRNPVAFGVFRTLPEDLQGKAVAEIVEIAKLGLVDRVMDELTGPAGRQLDRILPALEKVPLATRSQISRRLYQAGFDVEVPGVPRQDVRPWR